MCIRDRVVVVVVVVVVEAVSVSKKITSRKGSGICNNNDTTSRGESSGAVTVIKCHLTLTVTRVNCQLVN